MLLVISTTDRRVKIYLKYGGDATIGTLNKMKRLRIIKADEKTVQKPLQWHPAFCSSLQIELKDEPLEFHHEYNLTQKPLQMDVLIIKKNSDRIIKKNIGKIFRKHNVVEFKSPDDYLSVNDYYKVVGYACIYQANTEKVKEISPLEITISFVSNHYPREMMQWLEHVYHAQVIQEDNGIYYVEGLMFPTQVIVIKKLSKEENIWLSRLRPGLSTESDLNVLAEEYKGRYRNPLYATCMDVIMRANQNSYKKEGDFMCQALMELVDELYGDRLKVEAAELAAKQVAEQAKELAKEQAKELAKEQAKELAKEQAKELAKEQAKELAKEQAKELAKEQAKELAAKQVAEEVEKAINKTSITTLIHLIYKKVKRNKTEQQIVEELELEFGLVQQICQVIALLPADTSGEEIYSKWNEMFRVA